MATKLYDLVPMKAPRLAGSALRVLANVVEGPLGRVVAEKLIADAGVLNLRAAVATDPLPIGHPLFELPVAKDDRGSPEVPTAAADHHLPIETIDDFAAAYREQRDTPEKVAQRFLDAVRDLDADSRPLRAFISQRADDLLEQARASTERHRAGKPLSVLDGVPVTIKDEVDVRGYRTTVGTKFLGEKPAAEDSEVVARLRRAGALILGKANMHEIGLGVTGINPNHGPARNPFDLDRFTGGSSSGPAAAVAAGLSPLALGADGGGSIRIPASLCGQVGLKATFGRVPDRGSAGVCWTVGHLGPIGATVRDVAIGYSVMAGADEHDRLTQHQPPVRLDGIFSGTLEGVRLGIFRPWFEDADPEVVAAARGMVAKLESAGARVVEIELPELGVLRAAHQVTILAEMATSQLHPLAETPDKFGVDIRTMLALSRLLQPQDYVHAQRLRPRMLRHFLAALAQVDAIVSPTTACVAQPIPQDALETGESNLPLLDRITRFAPAPNFTGLPAITFPCGYAGNGMPIGLQAIGRAWEEHVLLRIAYAGETRMTREVPRVHRRLLK